MWQEIKPILDHPILPVIGTILLLLLGELVRSYLQTWFEHRKETHRRRKEDIYRSLYNEVADVEEKGAYRFVSKPYPLAYESLDYYSKDQIQEHADLLKGYCKKLHQLERYQLHIKTKLYSLLDKKKLSIIKKDEDKYSLSFGPYLFVGDPLIEECVLDIYRNSPERFVKDIEKASKIYPDFTSPSGSRTADMLKELRDLRESIKTIPEILQADSLDKEIIRNAKQIKGKLKKHIK